MPAKAQQNLSQIIVMTFSGKTACLFHPHLLRSPGHWPSPSSLSASGSSFPSRMNRGLSTQTLLPPCPPSPEHTQAYCAAVIYTQNPDASTLSGASCLFTVWQRALQSPGAGGDGGQLTDACVPSTPKQGSGLCQLPKRRGDEQCCRLQQREALLAGCQGRPRGTLTRPGFYECVCVGSG